MSALGGWREVKTEPKAGVRSVTTKNRLVTCGSNLGILTRECILSGIEERFRAP